MRSPEGPLRVTSFPVKTPEKRAEPPPSFMLRMRAPEGTLRGHVIPGSPIGHAQWYYCTTSIVVVQNVPIAHAQSILPWLPVPVRTASGSSSSLLHKCYFVRSHILLSIYMQQHSSSICIWSINSLNWYSRVCGSYKNFLGKESLLTRTILKQWFLVIKLGSPLGSFTVDVMTWLTVTECLCHRWLRTCCECHTHNPYFSLFVTFQQEQHERYH